MKKTLFILSALVFLCGCRQGETFCIEGNITGADSLMLYLEHLSLSEGPVAIDSVRLKEDGAFRFEEPGVASPEFYRLRIGGQGINLAIDSTECVRIKADMKNLSFGYGVEGSGTCDTIRLLCLKLADLERDVRRISTDRNFTIQERDSIIERLVDRYKAEVKKDFLHGNYGTAYSYYACFQTLGQSLIFDPMHDKSDLTWMRAVANAWNDRFPSSPRTQNLCNIVQEGRRNLAKPRQIVLDIDGEKVRELGIIDMTFHDIRGQERTLSDLRGNVILLDFTAFSLDGSTERTLLLREIYEKFHDKGFEIYQVSVDASQHLWKQRSEALPWVSVYCDEGLESDMLTLYDVQRLPSFFLIDRNCDLQARGEDIPDLEKAIEALL
ncbi:MAG: redoxin domain-containing protein [Bacteroidaceae bacterium]|nr:redoxin domain-containing protein [Bacteroidaceae bacterium]